MTERSQNSYPLLRQFREFYTEVARLRRMAENARSARQPDSRNANVAAPEASATQPIAPQPPAQPAATLTVAAEPTASAATIVESSQTVTQRVWNELAHYLDQKMYEVNLSTSSLSHDLLLELVYIMSAFADEKFVYLDWPGKDYWRDHLMELRLFRTQIAGQNIFSRIDKLLLRQEYGTDELASIYLMALALGFKGQYWRDPDAIESYRKKLFDRLAMTKPELRRASQRLFPEAHRYTVSEGAPVRLPEPRAWWFIVTGVVGLWLVLSTIAWLRLTSATGQHLDVLLGSLQPLLKAAEVSSPTSRRTALPFTLQNGAYRVDLPSTLALTNSASGPGGAAVGPLLIAVSGPNGSSPGSAAQVGAWLANQGSVTPDGHKVGLVEPLDAPPSEITASRLTQFFVVDPGLHGQDLAQHPQLSFPANGATGISIEAMTLYFTSQPSAVTQ